MSLSHEKDLKKEAPFRLGRALARAWNEERLCSLSCPGGNHVQVSESRSLEATVQDGIGEAQRSDPPARGSGGSGTVRHCGRGLRQGAFEMDARELLRSRLTAAGRGRAHRRRIPVGAGQL